MQSTYGVVPDLCTLGKAIGGGMPLSLFGGKRAIMEHVAPLGRAQHSGTYNGHLSAIAGGLAFFDVIEGSGCYQKLLARCQRLYAGIDEIVGRLRFPARVQGLGARFSILFGPPAGRQTRQYQDVIDNDWPLFHRFCAACMDHGVYLHTMWHHGISTAHSDDDIDRALAGIEAAFRDVLAGSSKEIGER
jgi:glutamate-1-semialdehyde 2,1-aminomutase